MKGKMMGNPLLSVLVEVIVVAAVKLVKSVRVVGTNYRALEVECVEAANRGGGSRCQ